MSTPTVAGTKAARHALIRTLLQHGTVHSQGELAARLADDRYAHVEAPLVFRELRDGSWYLWVVQYSVRPQGYLALRTDDLASGDWHEAPGFSLPPDTKHGVVVPLTRARHAALAAAYPP